MQLHILEQNYKQLKIKQIEIARTKYKFRKQKKIKKNAFLYQNICTCQQNGLFLHRFRELK